MGCFCPIGVSWFGLVGIFHVFRGESFRPDFLYKFQLVSFCLWPLWQLFQLMPWTHHFFFFGKGSGGGGKRGEFRLPSTLLQ